MIDECISQTELAPCPSERDVVKHDTPLKEHLHHVRICLFDIEVLRPADILLEIHSHWEPILTKSLCPYHPRHIAKLFVLPIGHVPADLVWRYCTSWIVLMDGLEELPLAFLSQKREPDPFVFVE